MEIDLDTHKGAAQNANELFKRAKKLEDKASKAEEALRDIEVRLNQLKQAQAQEVQESSLKETRKRKWYEKFRWFYSRTGKLIVGGRDATTNDILMKKHAEDKELVFHADIVGAPFFVIKEAADPESIEDAAQAAAIFSRAWKLGYGSLSRS